MTLNQIIAKIKTAAESHKMVGKFAVGAEFDFAVDEVKYYPLVWLVPNGLISTPLADWSPISLR
jgi:hypothetical protein